MSVGSIRGKGWSLFRSPRSPVIWPLNVLVLIFAIGMMGVPIMALITHGGPHAFAQAMVSVWADEHLQWRLAWSIIQAAATCLAAIVIGVPIAWVLARFDFAGRRWLLQALMLPFVVPTLVAALGVLALWGRSDQDTPWPLLYGNLFLDLCIIVRAGVDAFEQVSAARYAAARSLGATPWRAFWRIEWPAAKPSIGAALCLVFLYCMTSFGLALILGGQAYATIEVEIYTLVAHELKIAEASALSVSMIGLSFLVALLYAAWERRLAAPARADRLPRIAPTSLSDYAGVVAAVAALCLICFAPIGAILMRISAADTESWNVLAEAETWRAIWNTLRFSGAAILLAIALAIVHALAAQHSTWLRAAIFFPFVVSPVIIAFGLLIAYPQWSASVPLLIGAYALIAYPFIANALTAALDAIPGNLVQAARSLGAPPWRVFWRVTRPAITPALMRGTAFATATAIGEFAVSLFLSRPEWTTLTTLIYQRLGRPGARNLDEAMILATLLMFIAFAAFLLIDRSGRQSDHA
jgi:thiamine transport system permease protein